MSSARFFEHIKDPSPGFVCQLPLNEIGEWTARVVHRLNPPATADSLALLTQLLGQEIARPFELLYRVHDGMRLYEDVNLKYVKLHPKEEAVPHRAAGIEFYSIATWQAQTKTVLEDYFDWMEEDLEELKGNCVVFGEICHSGNYFAVRTAGPDCGKIIYLDHDPGWDEGFPAKGMNLEALLSRIAGDPARFLNDLGCYTRFYDGETERQWIPIVYHPDLDGS